MCVMCNPRQAEGQRVLEEDNLELIALIASYWGKQSVSKDTRQEDYKKYFPKTDPKTNPVGHEHT